MGTIRSNTINYDRGSFQLVVDYEYTDSAIKFTPYILVGGGGFGHDHTAVFSWVGPKTYTKNKNGSKVWKDPAATVKQRTVRQTGKYYADPLTQTKPKKIKVDVLKKKKKKKKVIKKWGTGTVKRKTDISGKKFSNSDQSVTIKVYLKAAGGVKNSSTLSITLKQTSGPFSPGEIDHNIDNKGRNNNIAIATKTLKGTDTKPIQRLQYQRLSEDRTTSGWSEVGDPITFPSSIYGAEGLREEIKNSQDLGKRLWIRDYGLQPGSRYKWKAVVTSGNGKTAEKVDNIWYYTAPPALTNVSHERIDDKTNRVYFTRSARDIILGIIKGYVFEYNTLEPDDPEFDSGWNPIPDSDWENHNINPHQSGGIMTKDYDDVAFDHVTCKKDTKYRYRLYATNYFVGTSNPGYSAYSSEKGTETTYNTPDPPASIKPIPNADYTNVTIEITPSKTKQYTSADRVFVRRRLDGGEWTYVTSETDGDDLTSLEYIEEGNTKYYKFIDDDIISITGHDVDYAVAFGCSKTRTSGQMEEGNGRSKYCDPVLIKMLAAPNKPNLIMPIDNTPIAIENGTVRLGWVHSPKDGTDQEGARLQYKIGEDGQWTDISATITTNAYYDFDISSFAVNSTIYWRASTKGKHADYSEWSTEKKFRLLAKPLVGITSIGMMDTISSLPVNVVWSYSDQSGTLSKMDLDIMQDGDVLKEFEIDLENLPAPNTFKIEDYLFDDGGTYEILLTATSTSGFSSETNVTFSVAYTEMNLTKGFMLSAAFDEDTGCSKVTISRIIEEDAGLNHDGELPENNIVDPDENEPITSNAKVKKIYVYRIYRGERELINEGGNAIELDLSDYDSFKTFDLTDIKNPINADFEYALMQITELGEVSVSSSESYRFETIWWYIYWGEDEIIKTRWNPTGSGSLGRPERQEVRYSGRDYPVLYDSVAKEETYSYNFLLLRDPDYYEDEEDDNGYETLQKFKEMMKSGGTGLWKSFEGDVYPAKFEFSWSSSYLEGIPSWTCSLNVGRIESGDF